MLKFSLIIPIILSSLYISLSRAQGTLSSCATNCSETIGNSAGCNPNQLNTPNCVCLNANFFGTASACVWLECDAAEASSAEMFWLGVCSSYSQASMSSVASSGYVPPSSFVSSTSGGYGGHASSVPGTSSNAYSIATNTPITSSNTNPYGASGPSTSSKPSASTSSNLAATMPTHPAALIAGGIGAMVAVFV